MKNWIAISTFISFLSSSCAQNNEVVGYLSPVIIELQKKWPDNRTINFVFHGHSVPSGYLTGGVVNTLDSYPYKSLKKIKDSYSHAVINAITTSIGGEQSEQGAKRFKQEVLVHRPDVLFIDYALNDRAIGLERAKIAWRKMITEAKAYGAKVVLMTPTPDLTENINSSEAKLDQHSEQIKSLAKKFKVGLVDSYAIFREIAKEEDLDTYMAQSNHINEKGHELVAAKIARLFEQKTTHKE